MQRTEAGHSEAMVVCDVWFRVATVEKSSSTRCKYTHRFTGTWCPGATKYSSNYHWIR